jgi:hypothetical protein
MLGCWDVWASRQSFRCRLPVPTPLGMYGNRLMSAYVMLVYALLGEVWVGAVG